MELGKDREKIRETIRLLLEDDHSAWCDLVDSYSGLLFGLARSIFGRYGRKGTTQDVEDAVMAVWRNLLEDDRRLLRKCLDSGEILPLLHTLLRNRCIDMMRKAGARRETSEEPGVLEKFPAAAESFPENEFPGEKMRAALESLPARERACISLFYLQERSYREISEITGLSVNSIGPAIHRALGKLKSILGEAGPLI